jgi:phosphoribosyl 1,2-cyclic phosphate phosphodiesterase
MKLRILGCGPSSGVPRIGNDWGECDPKEPRNRRTRTSILFESGGQRLLVDCGPDLREQLLAADVATVDGVIVTHDHADHCHGIDDLRPIAADRVEPIPCFARRETLDALAGRFAYIFEGAKLYRPTLEPRELGEESGWGSARLRFVDQPHGHVLSLGIRADEAGQSVGYAIDFNALTPDMVKLYQDLSLWICAITPHEGHPTHAGLDAAIDWARDLRADQLLLTHLDKSLDYATLAARLPDWAEPAYDGLEIIVE